MQGMSKGDNTRSGLLWEVERLLNEVEELPQVLLMENVPQVIGKKNIDNFHSWQKFLEEKGYSNYTEILNAKDYGVAQNRERCFMVSILGKWNYNFPKPIPLTKTMKDYLEDAVDEKYYINNEKAQKLIQQLIENEQLKDNKTCADGTINNPKIKDVSNCIKARYDAGISNLKSDGGVVIEVNQLGNIMPGTNRENPNQGRVYDKNALAPTLSCMGGGNREPMIVIGSLQDHAAIKTDGVCTTLTEAMGKDGGQTPMIVASRGRNPDKPSDRTPGNHVEQRLEPNSEGICNTLTSVQKDNLVLETNYRIRKLTPKECWRLMAFTDEDFHKAEQVNSNTQLYKQAGNSIVVKVLEAIFKQML